MPTSKTEGGDSWYLSDISSADKPWDLHRAQSDEFERLLKLCDGRERYIERVRECSQWLTYALKAKDDGEVTLKLREARFCRVRHCPVCQWRKSLMWRARFFKALPKIQEKYPTGRWVFLTLTIKNCELTELRSTLDKMNKAWQRLTQRKVFPALGFLKSVEVTRKDDGTAHPHFHCLMLVPAGYFSRGYISQAAWGTLWQSCLKTDYTPMVNIKVVKPPKGTLSTTPEASNEAMMKAVCETIKYSVKPADVLSDPKWSDELIRQLDKTHAISLGGCFKEFLSEKEPEDLINGDIEEEEKTDDDAMLFFEWASVVKRYTKGNSRELQQK